MHIAMPIALGMPGGWEIIVILLVVFLLFGTRLPKVARSLGQGISEFKDGLKGIKDDVDKAGEKKKDDGQKDDGQS